MSTQAILVMTTCGSPGEASRLAETLVAQRIAACVNRVEGICSTFRWESKVQHANEVLVLIKTTEERMADVQSIIKKRASYELPEIISVRITGGSSAYLEWLAEAVGPEG